MCAVVIIILDRVPTCVGAALSHLVAAVPSSKGRDSRCRRSTTHDNQVWGYLRRTKPEEETMSNPREGDERQGDAGVSDLLRLGSPET